MSNATIIERRLFFFSHSRYLTLGPWIWNTNRYSNPILTEIEHKRRTFIRPGRSTGKALALAVALRTVWGEFYCRFQCVVVDAIYQILFYICVLCKTELGYFGYRSAIPPLTLATRPRFTTWGLMDRWPRFVMILLSRSISPFFRSSQIVRDSGLFFCFACVLGYVT